MVGPGDEVAAGAAGHRHLRASDEDREHAIDVLKVAFVQGRVAKDEFDLRVGQVLASWTYAELEAITADIPAGLAAAKPSAPQVPARIERRAPARAAARERAIGATAIFTALAWILALFSNEAAGPFLAGTVSALVSLYLLRTHLRNSRREERSGGEPPAQHAIGSGPGAGSPAASAASAQQLPYAGKPRRGGKADAARPRRPRLQPSS
jgi:hypothetical protein